MDEPLTFKDSDIAKIFCGEDFAFFDPDMGCRAPWACYECQYKGIRTKYCILGATKYILEAFKIVEYVDED